MAHRARIRDLGWSLIVGGFRIVQHDDVEDLLRRVGEEATPCTHQLFDGGRVAGWEHLHMAAVNALKAFKAGRAHSRSLAMEVLLYASCDDQISRALGVLGVSSSTRSLALLVMSSEEEEAERCYERASRLLGEEDDSVLLVDDEKLRTLMEVYQVSEEELQAVGGSPAEALTSLIIERGALLAIRR